MSIDSVQYEVPTPILFAIFSRFSELAIPLLSSVINSVTNAAIDRILGVISSINGEIPITIRRRVGTGIETEPGDRVDCHSERSRKTHVDKGCERGVGVGEKS